MEYSKTAEISTINSTTSSITGGDFEENYPDQAELISWPPFLLPFLIIITIILFAFCVAVIALLAKTGRSFTKLRHFLVYHLAMNANNDNGSKNNTTIASPNDKGRFQPPIWCAVCNDYVNHVENLCPHVGRKFYRSVLQRRLFEYWRGILHQHYHQPASNHLAAPSKSLNINPGKVSPAGGGNKLNNCTIDLNDLITSAADVDKALERKVSRVSIVFTSSPPRDASTPNVVDDRCCTNVVDECCAGKRPPPAQRLTRTETGFIRIRKILRSWSSRRIASAGGGSSGMGDSICSSGGRGGDLDDSNHPVEEEGSKL